MSDPVTPPKPFTTAPPCASESNKGLLLLGASKGKEKAAPEAARESDRIPAPGPARRGFVLLLPSACFCCCCGQTRHRSFLFFAPAALHCRCSAWC
jgi:hypothetical protein